VNIERLRGFAKQRLPEWAQSLLRRAIVAKRTWLPRARFSFPTAPVNSHASAYEFAIAKDNPLEELSAKYLPIKRFHNYLPYYWRHFRDIRFEVGKVLVDHVMYWPKGFRPEDWPHLDQFPRDASWADKNVIGVAFYRWIVFVMRGNNPADNPYLTPDPSVRGDA
jgi:hypothetical protein